MRSDAPFVAVVGGANVDIHGRSDSPLIEHDSNPGSILIVPGGVARNVAENLARLDTGVRLVSAVGADDNGRMLLQTARDAGIDMSLVQTNAELSTAIYLSILDHKGELQVAIADMHIIEQLGPEQLAGYEADLRQAALVVVDTNLAGDALGWITGTLAAQTLFVDTVSTTKALRIKPYLAAVHTLQASRIEAEALSGIAATGQQSLPDIAQWFHEQGVQRLFVTLGAQGVFYSTGEGQGQYRLDTADARVRNVGGAGDAFLAGLACAWLHDLSLEETLRLALAAADVTLASPGTNSPALSRAAITARLEKVRG